MVAKIKSGKSIRGILNYNENKVGQAEAQLLLASGFLRSPDQLSFNNKLDRFELLTSQNERSQTNALHITLNFSRKDILDDDLMQKIAMDYMQRIGFGGQPYLVYRHFDAAHPHLHIATVTIENGGNRIETFNIGKNQSEAARKEIEINYGLIKAEDQSKEMAYMLRPAKLDKVVYGKAETKAAISGIIRDVISSYKFTSLPELNAILRQFNVMADRGEPGTKMYEKKGLVYCLLNEQGEKTGVPIKASSIYESPTIKNLEKKFSPNDMARKPFGLRLKHQLDKAIASARNIDELKAQLQKQGIRILLRENVQGNIYGITFIDNATRVVFNGSDLGKQYGAAAFLARLPKEKFDSPAQSKERDEPNTFVANENYPAQREPVIVTLLDIALSSGYDVNMPDPFRKKKKKRLQAE
jgi:hypothetical protein